MSKVTKRDNLLRGLLTNYDRSDVVFKSDSVAVEFIGVDLKHFLVLWNAEYLGHVNLKPPFSFAFQII